MAGVEARGVKEAAAALDAAASDLGNLTPALQVSGRRLAAAVQEEAPVRTGRLAASVSESAGPGVARVTVGGPGVDYARPVAARDPFTARAARRAESQIVATITEAVADLARRVST